MTASKRETPPTPATPMSDAEWQRMLIAIRYVVRRAWELCDDSEETNAPTTTIRTAALRVVSEGLTELEALIPDEQGPASAGVAVTLVMHEIERLRAEASRQRAYIDEADATLLRQVGQIARLEMAASRLREALRDFRFVGGQLANCAFNLAQDRRAVEWRETLDTCRKQWDALSEKHVAALASSPTETPT